MICIIFKFNSIIIMKSVINLIRTPLGYSLLEGDNEINKSTSKPLKEKTYSLPKKFAQQNFTIYPYIPNKEFDNHKYILIPAKTQWFNLNSVHEIEKKALPEWFKIKKGILATMNNIKFEKHQQLYKKYRNYIIELGKEEYVTASRARKGLAGDACAIIRIHNFLEKWGLINYIHKKKTIPSTGSSNVVDEPKAIPLNKRKDCFDRDKVIVSRTYNKDDLELLKKITRKFRPVCHFCQGITGIIWYEYNETFQLKEFQPHQGKRSATITHLPETVDYVLTVCASCFYQGSIPTVLASSDFKKKTIVESLEEQSNHESEKKKNNEQNKIADAIQKNRFKINKTAEQLKMTPTHVFTVLMTMPIQKLEKISRIQPETDAEKDEEPSQRQQQAPNKNQINGKQKAFEIASFQEKIIKEVNLLQSQQRQIYEKFLQSWLVKINTKFQRLSDWQSCVSVKYNSIERLQKNLLAERVQSLSKNL